MLSATLFPPTFCTKRFHASDISQQSAILAGRSFEFKTNIQRWEMFPSLQTANHIVIKLLQLHIVGARRLNLSIRDIYVHSRGSEERTWEHCCQFALMNEKSRAIVLQKFHKHKHSFCAVNILFMPHTIARSIAASSRAISAHGRNHLFAGTTKLQHKRTRTS